MVYIVQQDEYDYKNVIGLFESLTDALICASTEEALNDCRCNVFSMDIKESSNDDKIYDLSYRYPESDLPESAIELIKSKKEKQKKQTEEYNKQKKLDVENSIQQFCDLGGNDLYLKFINHNNNLVDKLIAKEISLEEYKEKNKEFLNTREELLNLV